MIGGVLVAAPVAATAMAGVAVVQRSSAERHANRADTAAREMLRSRRAAPDARGRQRHPAADFAAADIVGTLAEARRLGTQALVEDDYDQRAAPGRRRTPPEDSPETSEPACDHAAQPRRHCVIRSETEAVQTRSHPTADTGRERILRHGMSKYDVTARALKPPSPELASPARSVLTSPCGDAHFTVTPRGDRFELRIVDMATFEVVATLPGTLDMPLTAPHVQPGRQVRRCGDGFRFSAGAAVYETFALVWAWPRWRPGRSDRFSAPNFGTDGLPPHSNASSSPAPRHCHRRHRLRREVARIDGAHPPIAISPDGKARHRAR